MTYIRFTFQNIEPLKVADDSNSQSGEAGALSYVPGSALRGAIIQAFIKAGEFDDYKASLLSDRIAFLNAYIMRGGKELIPSLKGFYEDKADSKEGAKKIENLLSRGSFTEGNKRAALGQYCYLDDGCIRYTSVDMGSDMKINRGTGEEKKNVFRNQFINPGQQFAAYIAVFGEGNLAEEIKEKITTAKETGTFFLGGSRSFGYGQCEILDVALTEDTPYMEYAVKSSVKNETYLALLSNTTMLNEWGNPVGVDRGILRDKLNLSSLEIENCATSVVDVRGYNRTWHTWTPGVKMFEMGSVFKLTFPGEEIPWDKMKTLMEEGLGIRTNEGYGRVIFLNQYDRVCSKEEIALSEVSVSQTEKTMTAEEEETLGIVARGYYRNLIDKAVNAYLVDDKNGLEKFGLNGSQLGTIESILTANLYNSEDAFVKLDSYFATANKRDEDQNTQNDAATRAAIAKYINDIKNQKVPEFLSIPKEVMGMKYTDLFTDKESSRIKQKLIISQIKMENRKGDRS